MMKTIKAIIIHLLRIVGLVLILSLERVVGLPFIFSLLALIWLDRVEGKIYSRPLLILLFSFLMAVFYHGAWLLTLVVWLFCGWAILYSSSIVQGKKRRLIILVVLQNLFWLWWLDIPTNFTLIFQLIVSYIVVVLWLKVFKLDKVKQS